MNGRPHLNYIMLYRSRYMKLYIFQNNNCLETVEFRRKRRSKHFIQKRVCTDTWPIIKYQLQKDRSVNPE